MASCSADNTVKMWDLRKIMKDCNFQTFQFPDSEVLPQSVTFDYSGIYLACAGDHIRIFLAKTLEQVVLFQGHTSTSTCVQFGPDARWIASTSMDRTVKFWGFDGQE